MIRNSTSRRGGRSAALWTAGVAAGLLAGLLAVQGSLRRRDPGRTPEPSTPVAERAVPVRAAEGTAAKPGLRRPDRNSLAALLASVRETVRPSMTKEDLLRRLREAAAAHGAGEREKFAEILDGLTALGPSIQKMLAQVLMEEQDPDVREVAASALVAVATEEICPFLFTLARVDGTEEIRSAALSILVKYRFAEAAPYLEYLLFSKSEPAALRGLAVDFFAAVSREDVLLRALREVPDLRSKSAPALASSGSEAAGRALFEVWSSEFTPSESLGQYFLLQELARFRPEILEKILDEGMKTIDDPSQRNILVSLLAHAERGFAVEQVRSVLEGSQEVSLRRQAIHVAASLGGEEGQSILVRAVAEAATQEEALAAASGLLRQEGLALDFDAVRAQYASETDPLLRSSLATLLSLDPDRLASDPALAASLGAEAERNLASDDPALRGVNIRLSASLAPLSSDPPAKLVGLYWSLSPEERDAHPDLMEALGAHSGNPEVREILRSSVTDATASIPRRVTAGDALFTSGDADPVYEAIRTSEDPQVVSMMSWLVLARGDEAARARLGEIATTSQGEKQELLQQKMDAWPTAAGGN